MSWTNVRGHDEWRKRFQHVWQRGRLAHAYLFVGPQGIGKRLFAIELAKALTCEASAAFDACDQCPACLQVMAGTHPDVRLMSRPAEKLEFPIDLIREVTSGLGVKPARAPRRIVILDDVDQMSDDAANAFLKSLEEPPPLSLLILIGQTTDHFFSTIVSRCQVIRFDPLPPLLIEELLLQDKAVSGPGQAKQVSQLSGGSLGLARQLADPDVFAFRQEWLKMWKQPRFDSVALAAKVNEFVEAAGSESAVKRQRAHLALRFLADELILALREAAVQSSDHPWCQRWGVEVLLRLTEALLDAESHIDRRVQLVLLLEAFTDRLADSAVR